MACGPARCGPCGESTVTLPVLSVEDSQWEFPWPADPFSSQQCWRAGPPRSSLTLSPLYAPPVSSSPRKGKEKTPHKIQHSCTESARRNNPKACVWPLTESPSMLRKPRPQGPRLFAGCGREAQTPNVHREGGHSLAFGRRRSGRVPCSQLRATALGRRCPTVLDGRGRDSEGLSRGTNTCSSPANRERQERD